MLPIPCGERRVKLKFPRLRSRHVLRTHVDGWSCSPYASNLLISLSWRAQKSSRYRHNTVQDVKTISSGSMTMRRKSCRRPNPDWLTRTRVLESNRVISVFAIVNLIFQDSRVTGAPTDTTLD